MEDKGREDAAGKSTRRDHELVIERVYAIDVAKAVGKGLCALAAPEPGGRRSSGVWDVEATTGAVTELADHLVGVGIEKVTAESTSDYRRIWFYLLESAGLAVQLVNAREVKNVLGRPNTDKLESYVMVSNLGSNSAEVRPVCGSQHELDRTLPYRRPVRVALHHGSHDLRQPQLRLVGRLAEASLGRAAVNC